ncbi:putative mitochondrial protein [Cucumis melo var. makuwa]|uniref:Mitochondrial protein n=1 Tax=Cucumis melo var. makuwa TaxID=1194695 RepID=A0A5D3D714_CUCMM|nr:putative mitochondrial protein [Cucumis melo var. makuwa]TYK19260.1 putative mitochondrial protein [Cucumis melo var. makuwa]
MTFPLPLMHFVPLFELAAATSPLKNFTPFSFRKKQPWPKLQPLKPFQQLWWCFTHFSITAAADEDTVSTPLARLVAKGYHQVQGFDFDETFSPVVKKPTILIILALAAQYKLPLTQLDVKNAFLHGIL